MAESIRVGTLKQRQQAVLTAVAAHCHGTLRGTGQSAYLVVGGKRKQVMVANLEVAVGGKPPALRFDRVVLRVLSRLQTALHAVPPMGRVVVVTLTAPIKLPAKTIAAVVACIGELSGTQGAREPVMQEILGNRVRLQICRAAKGAPSRLVGFVHNRDSPPAVLFELTRALLRHVNTQPGASARWLVIGNAAGAAWTETCQHVCEQLFTTADWERVLMVDADGRVTTLPAKLRASNQQESTR